MIEEVVNLINKELLDIFGKYPGVKVYGFARTMSVKQSDGSTYGMPVVVDSLGEGQYVGIDDTAPLIFYHKNNALNLLLKPGRSGYGDERAESVNQYNNSLIVYLDRSKIKVNPDEIHLYIQNRVPARMPNFEKFKSVLINFQNVILNSQTVYQTEYPNGLAIDPKMAMISIGYQVESTFSRVCFAECECP